MLKAFTHSAAVQLPPSVLFLYGMQPNTWNREQRVHASPNTLSDHTTLHIIATYHTPSLGMRCSHIACELLGNQMVKAVGCGPGSPRFNSPTRQQGFLFCFRGTQLHFKLRRRVTFRGDITSLVWGTWLIKALPSSVLSNNCSKPLRCNEYDISWSTWLMNTAVPVLSALCSGVWRQIADYITAQWKTCILHSNCCALKINSKPVSYSTSKLPQDEPIDLRLAMIVQHHM